jgi:hypothetical protein
MANQPRTIVRIPSPATAAVARVHVLSRPVAQATEITGDFQHAAKPVNANYGIFWTHFTTDLSPDVAFR